ncbi:hypothetical protein Chor_001784 [Crotalus horridus]
MGKPLSRPDCLRQSPACLGKGEDEDGYIEDCYVPQRSIYDTMRINEQIDQGAKLNQPSKSTLEKRDSSTISSNGTLGAPGALELKVQESKKLDERVIFDALKLSSDVPKSALAPPRRRPNLEKKENINRRSWKSFMPPNFPEFAERIEASLSEVSETAASDPSLQEKARPLTVTESCSPSEHRESLSEPLTLEHVPKSSGVRDIQEVRPPREALREFSQEECQPLLEPEEMVVDLTGGRQKGHRLVSATWPRVVKTSPKAPGLRAGHDILEADDSECVIETVPLSPCLSEELLDPGMGALLTPGLREKTESELRFEEDERLIMMEAEEWEEGSLSEKGKAAEETKGCSTGISEERGQLCLPFMTVEEAVKRVAGDQGTYNHPLHQQELWDDSEPQAASSALVPQETHQDLNPLLGEDDGACSAEAVTIQVEEEEFASGSEACFAPPAPEQFSDTDSVQMFLELERLCMNEEEKDGEAPTESEVQNVKFSSEGLDLWENLDLPSETVAEPSQHLVHHEISVADSAMVSDLEDFDATFGSQVASATEPTLSESFSEQDTFGDSEKGMLSNPAVAKDVESQYGCHHSSSVTLVEENGAELLMTDELAKSHKAKGQLDLVLREPVVSVHVPCCRAQPPCICVAEEEMPPLFSRTERTSLSHGEFVTVAEDLDSQQELDLIEGVGSLEEQELFASYERNPSEKMMDFSNWDVPELGSEDEVVELDKENIVFATHPEETEGMGNFWAPLPSDSEVIQGFKESKRHTRSSDNQKYIDSSSRCQLEHLTWPVDTTEMVISTTFFQEEEPKMAEQVTVGTAVERDFMEPGILELLFGQSGSSEVTEEGESDAKFVDVDSRPSVPVDCSWDTQGSVEDFACRPEEEATSSSPLPGDEDIDVLPDPVEELASTIKDPCTTNAKDITLSSLSGSLTSVLDLDLSVEDATSLIGDGDDSETAMWVCNIQELIPVLQTAEEISSLPMPLCPFQCPGKEGLPIQEEWTMIPSSSEESIQVIQGMDESILPLNLSLEAAEHPSQWESSLLILAFEASRDVPSSPAQLPASEAEEKETYARSGREALSSFSTAAGTSELVPDNEQFQKEQVDPLQLKLQQVNRLGQGLVQSAGKNCDVQGLEHDMEEIHTRWNTLNKKVAQRIAQLQEALLHCGKFQDALEPLLSWLADTEELISNQKPPSTEYKVVKAQIQEQKEWEEGGKEEEQVRDANFACFKALHIKAASQAVDKLSAWEAARQSQLEEVLVLAKQFHETSEPISEWLSATDKKLANSEPLGTQTAKIQQQIVRHKALEEEIDNQATAVTQVVSIGHSLALLSCRAEQASLAEKLDLLESRYAEVSDRCSRKAALLDQALSNARLFGEDEVEVLNWLAEAEDKLSLVSIKDYKREVLQQQHSGQLALNDEIVNRKKHVDQAIKNGQALLKQTTGEEVLLIQEKLDGIKTRYSDITAASSKALRTLEQARQLATKFQSTHEELTGWMGQVEEELMSGGGHSPTGEQIPQFQQRQKELKNEVMEHQIILDTVNEVSHALLELVPWRAREGLDKLVSDTNERYKATSDTINRRVAEIDAAIQRSQQYEQAADAELAWVAETRRKLLALGPIRLEQDQTTAQLQVQKAFSIDIIRHKDSVDELLNQRTEILGTCGEEQKVMLQEKTESLLKQYDETSHLHSERYARLERAQVLVNQFWETYEELSPWLEETQALIGQLPPPAIDHEHLKQQQEDMRQLRESIAEHKPHIDKLLKIGPQLTELNPEEGAMVQGKYLAAEAAYSRVKEEVRQRALALDEAISQSTQVWEQATGFGEGQDLTVGGTWELQKGAAHIYPHINAEFFLLHPISSPSHCGMSPLLSVSVPIYRLPCVLITIHCCVDSTMQIAEFHDKIEPMLETLENLSSRLRMPPLIPAEVEKIRECIGDNKNATLELEKLQPSFEGLKRRGEELIGRSQGADRDLAAKNIQDKLDQMVFFWEDIKARAEEREIKFLDVLELAEKFWYDMAALLTTIRDTQDIVHDLESPGIDPSIIKQQIEAAETIKEETDSLHEELEFIRILGADLIFACGETEKPEVKKSIDEMNSAWEHLNRTWKERLEKLEEAMQSAVQYQDNLQTMFDWLDNTVIKLCNMSPVGTDLCTVKEQLNEMKEFKTEVYQQQIEMEKLNHQGGLLLKKATDETDRDIIREPLTELKHLWENLGEKIAHRQHKLEGSLLALGQFQHALAELMAWLSHTEELLDSQRPINGDPKVIEVELAKHHVLKNDVLAHQATVETVNKAGNELLESSAGDDASSLRNRLETMNSCWESVLQKTEVREQQLQATLQQAQGFHGEIEDFLLWLTRMESQLSASKPTGGLPETAREQLNVHMELYAQFKANEEIYSQLLAKGRLMLLSRDDSGSGSKMEQSVALLEQKWVLVSTKMEERKSKLEEALNLATEFQNSLQDFINWLTLAEQGLNVASPPSLILNTVLPQVEEHKSFANEVNAHRHQIIALDQSGNQLKFLSQKQDVVLIKNLLVSVQSRWEKVVQRSVERGRALDDARKRAKQEFQKTLGGKQPVYDTTIRTGRALKEKAHFPDDTQDLDHLLGEVRDKWDTVCGKSVERQHKLEEALLFSGQFMDALQALVDWLYKVEPQLAEDQPVHGDLDLVMNLMDAHKVFQKELGKRTGTIQVLKRSGRELIENSRDDTTWVKVQLQELSSRWDTVCKMSVLKQTRLEQALKQAEEFRAAIHQLLEWLSEAEQTLRFRGALPDDTEALQSLIDVHKEFMKKVEEKRLDVNSAVGMGEIILSVCHPDCVTTIKHWITIIRARFEEVLTWAKQHQQRLEVALLELMANAELLEELLAWIQWAETTLIQREQEPQNIEQVKALIAEHQSFMEEMTRKQPDVDRVTKTYKRKATEPAHGPFLEKSRSNRKPLNQVAPPPLPILSQSEAKNPRVNQLSARWQQVWLLALERQRKLNDALDRLEELKEFANFDFDVWRKKYMRWMNHKKSRVMDFFRRIDKDQDGKITRQEFIDGILASKFPTTKLEMTAVADIFDRDGDGYIDYYEFVAALHPNKDAYRPTTDADKIEDEVTRQVAQCKCAKRFQVEQIGENKYRFFLGNQGPDQVTSEAKLLPKDSNLLRRSAESRLLWPSKQPKLAQRERPFGVQQMWAAAEQERGLARSRGADTQADTPTPPIFGDSQQLRLVRILRSTVMVRVGGGWMALDEFLVKNDPCRVHHPGSKIKRSDSSSSIASQSPIDILEKGDKQREIKYKNKKVALSSASKLKRPTFHSSRTSLAGDTSNSSSPASSGAKTSRGDPKKTASRPTSRAGSHAGSRASSRRGSDASDFDLLETQSACSDTSESSATGGPSGSRRGLAKPSKIPTMSKKTSAAKSPGPKR